MPFHATPSSCSLEFVFCDSSNAESAQIEGTQRSTADSRVFFHRRHGVLTHIYRSDEILNSPTIRHFRGEKLAKNLFF